MHKQGVWAWKQRSFYFSQILAINTTLRHVYLKLYLKKMYRKGRFSGLKVQWSSEVYALKVILDPIQNHFSWMQIIVEDYFTNQPNNQGQSKYKERFANSCYKKLAICLQPSV